MRIQNNIMAVNTHRQYTIQQDKVSASTEKLSSGYRINKAADDAAGLAISEKMRAQIRGLNMAKRNTQDAVSLIQTAEGALQEVHAMLQRMNELADQSATGTNQEFDRAQIDKEFRQLKREINDISDQTTFNNMKLLDGSLSLRDMLRTAQTSGLFAQSTPFDSPVTMTQDYTPFGGESLNQTAEFNFRLDQSLRIKAGQSFEINLQAQNGTVKLELTASEVTQDLLTAADVAAALKAKYETGGVQLTLEDSSNVSLDFDVKIDAATGAVKLIADNAGGPPVDFKTSDISINTVKINGDPAFTPTVTVTQVQEGKTQKDLYLNLNGTLGLSGPISYSNGDELVFRFNIAGKDSSLSSYPFFGVYNGPTRTNLTDEATFLNDMRATFNRSSHALGLTLNIDATGAMSVQVPAAKEAIVDNFSINSLFNLSVSHEEPVANVTFPQDTTYIPGVTGGLYGQKHQVAFKFDDISGLAVGDQVVLSMAGGMAIIMFEINASIIASADALTQYILSQFEGTSFPYLGQGYTVKDGGDEIILESDNAFDGSYLIPVNTVVSNQCVPTKGTMGEVKDGIKDQPAEPAVNVLTFAGGTSGLRAGDKLVVGEHVFELVAPGGHPQDENAHMITWNGSFASLAGNLEKALETVSGRKLVTVEATGEGLLLKQALDADGNVVDPSVDLKARMIPADTHSTALELHTKRLSDGDHISFTITNNEGVTESFTYVHDSRSSVQDIFNWLSSEAGGHAKPELRGSSIYFADAKVEVELLSWVQPDAKPLRIQVGALEGE
ncbi:hypothetical protein LJC56_09280, partial [Christensenellaceae bacterium OttesenSCG-928-K19]|nr:hypothetical protein [Christensenellaceae bacterium OttesenSCG-928-K19]